MRSYCADAKNNKETWKEGGDSEGVRINFADAEKNKLTWKE